MNEYMRALRIDEIDIDKVEVTRDNMMRHMSNIKEYSAPKVDFENI